MLVSAPALLHALSLKPGSVDGAKVKPYLELGEASMVPDAIINPLVLERLQQYPNSDDKSVKKALKKWRDLSPQLFKHYAHCMHVCDASGEMRAVVEQLAPCFLIKA